MYHAVEVARDLSAGTLIIITANLGSLGLGALLAGLLAQYAGHALQLPFLASEALMAGGALALAATPETVARPRPRPRYHPQRVSVPAADRPAFFAAGPGHGSRVRAVRAAHLAHAGLRRENPR